mmetsp:Transcript_10064/g.29891  ORF Transcript_10064/g.29891 Transcript_10064/m.29891 type:complete len:220 (+) Transcript_10064:258-917(+)
MACSSMEKLTRPSKCGSTKAIASMTPSTVTSPSWSTPNRTRPSMNSCGSSAPMVPLFTAANSFCKFPRPSRNALSTPNKIFDATCCVRLPSLLACERKPQRAGDGKASDGAEIEGSSKGSRHLPSNTPCSNRTCSSCNSSFVLSIVRKASAARRLWPAVLRTVSDTEGPAVRLRRCRCSRASTVAGRMSPGSRAHRPGVVLDASRPRAGMWMGSNMLKP